MFTAGFSGHSKIAFYDHGGEHFEKKDSAELFADNDRLPRVLYRYVFRCGNISADTVVPSSRLQFDAGGFHGQVR